MSEQLIKDLGQHLAESVVETMQMHMARAAIMDLSNHDLCLIASAAIQGVAATYASYIRATDPNSLPDRIAMQVASAIYKQVKQSIRVLDHQARS